MLRRFNPIATAKPLNYIGFSSSILCRHQSSSSSSSSSADFQSEVAHIFTASGQHNINTKKRQRLEEFQNQLLQKQKQLDAAAEKKPDFLAKFTLLYLIAQSALLNYWVY